MVDGNRETVYDAEKSDFDKAFGQFKEKRFAIYGIGRMSATLLPTLADYQIVGLMDRDPDNVGKILYGYPVITLEEAEKTADLVVINTAESYWNIIYNRIRGISIPVYYTDGTLAEDKEKDGSYYDLSYWSTSYKALKQEILRHDIISFDIFDTLIMRMVMDPIDIFHLIELQQEEVLADNKRFFELRKEASILAGKEATLSEIYAQLQRLTGLRDEQIQALKEQELEVEKNSFKIREDMVGLLREAVTNQKEVYLISDMYMEREFLLDIIYQFTGILLDASHLLVSSEKKKNKKDGSLWEEYADRIKEKGSALHIGDDEKGDEVEPRKFGIDTYRILKASEMLEKSSLASMRSAVCNVYESVIAGHIIEGMFNSPFALNATKGKVEIQQLYQMGYCVLGPIIYSFLKWLLKQADENKIKDYLFVARDGWFLGQDYDYYVKLSKKAEAPKGHYLAASRRLVSVAAVKTKEDYEEVLSMPYQGTFAQFMQERFNLLIENDKNAEVSISLPADFEKVRQWSACYREKIEKEIKTERKNYKKYLEQFGIDETSAIVDFCYHGTIQYYFQKVLDKTLNGYYFFADISESNPYYKNNMFACFQSQKDKQAKESELYKKWILLESFLTAPHGMIRYVDENGEFVCGKKGKNQEYFDERITINEGVKHFISDMVQSGIDRNIEIDAEIIDFIMKYYKCVMDGNSILGTQVKKIFYFDNAMVHTRELNIFE